MSKPSIPKGTRDFSPLDVAKRKYIFSTIESVFSVFGYAPIETPSMELLSTLTGKYGDEGDKLLFKVLNNGDFLRSADEGALQDKNSHKLAPSIAKRGMRYDLTVPFARFVVMHQNELVFPFKRYQIQPVWRADSPQRGRFQEFYQCDVDVVGSDSLMYEAELMQIYHQVFKKLGLKVNILINNRKILYGIAESSGIEDLFMEMTIAMDKLDKIGREGVKKEMIEKGINNEAAEKVLSMMSIESMETLRGEMKNSQTGLKGLDEVSEVFSYLGKDVDNVIFNVNLARGLNYYTGCIFEVVLDTTAYPQTSMGSIGGGGRYDDLTGTFGMSNMSGVGVSFGAERIFMLLDELSLFPEGIEKNIEILFVALDEESHKQAFVWLSELRIAGISADLYPEPAKMKKQMKYANDRKVPFVAIIGEEERTNGQVSLKNMETGDQKKVALNYLLEHSSSVW